MEKRDRKLTFKMTVEQDSRDHHQVCGLAGQPYGSITHRWVRVDDETIKDFWVAKVSNNWEANQRSFDTIFQAVGYLMSEAYNEGAQKEDEVAKKRAETILRG